MTETTKPPVSTVDTGGFSNIHPLALLREAG
nr:MAG TPA: hypothetical protein [Caudoviricetes sp.]